MLASELRTKVIHEIDAFPEEQLMPLYMFIHYFRSPGETGEDIMKFAGCWKDMSDTDFQDFLAEIEQRRHNAFSGLY
jgi:hypothetical protein